MTLYSICVCVFCVFFKNKKKQITLFLVCECFIWHLEQDYMINVFFLALSTFEMKKSHFEISLKIVRRKKLNMHK